MACTNYKRKKNRSATLAHFELSRNTSILDTFITQVQKIWDTRSFHSHCKPEDTLSFHNYRTLAGSYAFRVESVVEVVAKITKVPLSVNELRKAVKKSHYCDEADVLFYNTARNVWPIANAVQDMETGNTRLVPREEEEIEDKECRKMKAILIEKSRFDAMKEGFEAHTIDPEAYKSLVITSSFGGEYCFYDHVMFLGDKWYGYRGILATGFSHYCGLENFMHCDDLSEYPPWVSHVYSLTHVAKVYGYTAQDTPDEYKHPPFRFELDDDEQYSQAGTTPEHDRSDELSVGSSPPSVKWRAGKNSHGGSAKRAKL